MAGPHAKLIEAQEPVTAGRAAPVKSAAAPSSAAQFRKRIGNKGLGALRAVATSRSVAVSAKTLAPRTSGASRGLTESEIALAEKTFGGKLPYARIRICNGNGLNPIAWIAFKNGNPAITLGKTIYIGQDYRPDYSKAGAAGAELLTHELTHVLQYGELGVAPFVARYLRELAASGFDANATYDYELGKTPYRSATLEAQAEMVGDYNEAKLNQDAVRTHALEQNLAGSGLYGL